jgi:farnesyl diphosphate synthase
MPDPRPAPTGGEPRLDAWRSRSDHILGQVLEQQQAAEPTLQAAMRHAVLLGGKRMRPLLVYATGAAFGADEADLDAPAAAVELVHAYSLVHDDLPAMDDDALRRGQPTVHVAFDEATAILAGDALQSLAFTVLADCDAEPGVRVAMLRELAIASGARGMCGGQALDLAATGTGTTSGAGAVKSPASVAAAGQSSALARLEQLHALKTGALLRASVRLGALAAGVDGATGARLDAFADALGLAFQIRDDLLDVEGDSATLGKTAGKDAAQAKATFPALIGREASHMRLQQLAATMHEALAPFQAQCGLLVALGERAVHRRY